MAWSRSRALRSCLSERLNLGTWKIGNGYKSWSRSGAVLSSESGEGLNTCYANREGNVQLGSALPRSLNGTRLLQTSANSSVPEPTSADLATTHHHRFLLEESPSRDATKSVSSEGGFLQLENGKMLFSGMTSGELMATLLNLQLVAYEPMVDVSVKVFSSSVMRNPIVSPPLLYAVKRTAYSHFCAGENAGEAAVTLGRAWELGLKGILDYSLEDAEDNETCDKNCADFLSTIHHTKALPVGSVSHACAKISAICPIGVLERVSDLLRWQHRNPDLKLPWREDGLPILAAGSPIHQTENPPEELSTQEERNFVLGQERLRQLCEACSENGLPLLVDAEYSIIQPALDYMTYKAMFEFNEARSGFPPLVYNTLQTYLKDAPARLDLALAESTRRDASLALKIVRGAYITREKELAATKRAPSPIHNSIEDTHECYNACVSVMLERIASDDSAALMVATHNANSGKLAAQKILDLGLERRSPRVHFGQLKGMADTLSLALVRAGFNVSKYLAFGPVAHVIPYLVRRAEENRGLLGNSRADRRIIRAELLRRLAVGMGFDKT